jgi:hypothetical protein
LREILIERTGGKEATVSALAREAKIDRSYLVRIIKGKRFNDTTLKKICEGLRIPLYVGSSPPIQVNVRYAPRFKDPNIVQLRQYDYYSVPIVDPSVVARVPFTVTNDQVRDIAYIHQKALRCSDISKCICMVVPAVNMEPTIRKGAIISIDMGAEKRQ